MPLVSRLMPSPAQPVNVLDYERRAEEVLEEGALGYFAGGACDEQTLRENVAAFSRLKLRPRMLVDVSGVSTPATVAGAAPGAPRWFQLYCFEDDGVTRALVDQAVEHGYSALVLTVDAPRAGRRERDLRTGFQVPAGITIPSVAAAIGRPATLTIAEVFAMLDLTLTWRDLERIRGLSDLPLLVKGLMTEEDA